MTERKVNEIQRKEERNTARGLIYKSEHARIEGNNES